MRNALLLSLLGCAVIAGVAQTPVTSKSDFFQIGPVVQNVTNDKATLWWMATESAPTPPITIKYGTSALSLDRTVVVEHSPENGGLEYQVDLTELQPATEYTFELRSNDGKVKYSDKFRTENADYAEARFAISNGPKIEVVGKDRAIITWSTNARSSSVVHYGTDPINLDQTAMAPWGQERHRVRIRNLKPNTRYFFFVESSQAEGTGLTAKSNLSPFQTVGEQDQAVRIAERIPR